MGKVPLLRSRKMGATAYVDIVVDVPENVLVGQADQVAQQVKATTRKVLGREVEIHVRFQAAQAADRTDQLPIV